MVSNGDNVGSSATLPFCSFAHAKLGSNVGSLSPMWIPPFAPPKKGRTFGHTHGEKKNQRELELSEATTRERRRHTGGARGLQQEARKGKKNREKKEKKRGEGGEETGGRGAARRLWSSLCPAAPPRHLCSPPSPSGAASPPPSREPYYDDSKTKAMVEELLKNYENVCTLRVRMLISSDLSNPRNFITKIARYEKVVNIPNSMTILDELLPISIEMAKRNPTRIWNFTNPGVVGHNEILEIYPEHIDPSFTWKNFTLEEQAKESRGDECLCGDDVALPHRYFLGIDDFDALHLSPLLWMASRWYLTITRRPP